MKRRILRICFYLIKMPISMLAYFDGRIYMLLYNKLLSSFGIKMYGKPRFIAKSVKFDDFQLITLGNRLVASSNVIFLTHDYSYTTALISGNQTPKTDIGLLGPIYIGNNVFVGMNSIILPGTRVGNNVIIGAGSVVRGEIPDNVVVSGNPAKIIRGIDSHLQKLKEKPYERLIDKK